MSLYYDIYRPNYGAEVTTEIILKQQITAEGLVPTYEAADPDGNLVRPDPGTFLHVKNGSVSNIVVTVVDPNTPLPEGALDYDPSAQVTVPALGEAFIDLQDVSRFARTEDGMAEIQYSDVLNVTVGAFQL